MSYKTETQKKNLAWFLPRPKPDSYKGGMPLHAEEWLLELAQEITGKVPEDQILNLFAGRNKHGIRVDIKPEVEPDVLADAHELSKHFPAGRFKIILADPPYSTEEARDIYGTPPLKYKQWTQECDKVLQKDGVLIVYHKQVVPNPNPKRYDVERRVFIGNRAWHLPRVAIFFRKNRV